MKKILILYTSHTQGHRVIAENMGFYLERAGYDVKYGDILEIQAGWLITLTRAFHYFVNQYARFVWRWLYLSPTFTRFGLPKRLKVAGRNYRKTLAIINDYRPDCVITTQTTASAVVAYLKKENLYKGKLGVGFSDFHLHPFWLYEEVDFYLANIEEQKSEMISLGVPTEKIFVCGVMLKNELSLNTTEVRKKFNIKPEEKVVLVASGSFGYGLDTRLILELSAQPNLRVIVATGQNPSEKHRLRKKFAGRNITVLGFYSPWEELCSIADIFITKPGGLSTSEALQWRLPMMILYTLPGQEELNYQYLKSKGLIMPDPVDPLKEALEELSGGKFKEYLNHSPKLAEVLPKPEQLLRAVSFVLQGRAGA